MRVQTRYAKSGNLHVAYQVFGQGAIDLVWCPGFVSNIEHYWEDPRMAHYLERLASFARVITSASYTPIEFSGDTTKID